VSPTWFENLLFNLPHSSKMHNTACLQSTPRRTSRQSLPVSERDNSDPYQPRRR